MLIYAKQTGETFLYSENINQGSVNANGIDLLASFPKTAVVTAAFELPNGQVTSPKVLSLVSADTEIEGMHLWRYTFEAPITQYAGDLKISLFVTANGATIALNRVTVTLGASVPYVIPATAVHSWDSILEVYNLMLETVQNVLHDAELTGDTTAENLTVSESLKVPTPTEDDEAAPKGYVDELDKSSLKQVSSMPSNPSVGDIVQWVGGSAYKKGYFYKYNGSVWEETKVQDTEETARWGNIDGTLTDQTDLATALGTKQEKQSLSLQTVSKNIVQAINEVNSIAKGANIAYACEDYIGLVDLLNYIERGLFKTGQSFYIVTMNVPDVWVEEIDDEDEPTEYTYTSEEDLISALVAGTLYIGYYHIHPLETQKVDLTNYRTKAEQDVIDNGKLNKETSAGTTRAYVVNANGTQGTLAVENGTVPNSIALRGGNGQLYVANPTINTHAANKQYVDNAVNGIKGIIVEASTNKTVNGLQVPSLTDEQLLAIYNATVAGKAVTITDATGKMHFTGVTADMISDEVFVSFVYFDKMVLEYGEGNATTYKEILTTADVQALLPKIIRV